MTEASSYDYVIVGGGSAGCVLAGRLSEDPAATVCLLEAGPPDRSLFIHMPSGYDHLFRNPRYNWMYQSEPEPHLRGRRLYCPRGKTLGGSSAINAMCFLRGHALDYEGWARDGEGGEGLTSWSNAHLLPYFKRMETWSGGASPYRGGAGPLRITRPDRFSNPLSEVYLEAAEQAGHGFTEDVNGRRQEGCFRIDQTISGGRRSTAAVAFLRTRHPNLTVVTGARADRVLLERGRALGVEFLRGGRSQEVRAAREVILAAGAANSPKLLMLSGIGPANEIAALGLPVAHDLPGVGENLQDHVDFYLLTECLKPVTLHSVMNPLGKLRIGLEWLVTRGGLGATNHFEAGGYFRTDPGFSHPNIQNVLAPLAVSYEGNNSFKGHGYGIEIGIMRPASRGRIKARSANPADPPRIELNFLQEESDIEELRAGLDRTRDILAQKAFAPYRGRELNPGPDIRDKAAVHRFLRSQVTSIYHLSGTCRMGLDERAVVDEELKVRGIDGLRVVDASILPRIPSANINAPTLMVAEKAADMILGRDPLPPEHLPYEGVPQVRVQANA